METDTERTKMFLFDNAFLSESKANTLHPSVKYGLYEIIQNISSLFDVKTTSLEVKFL